VKIKQLFLEISFSVVVLHTMSVSSQTIIWSEDFDGNGGAGSNWGILNESIGIQGITENLWYISCQENGNAAGICGAGCGIDNSLHVGSISVGDMGAAYDASSLCLPGCFLCDFGFCSDVTTNKRSQSMNISTIGQSNLTLNFNYIENGQGTIDGCVVEYSINGGTSWIQLGDPAKTTLCTGGQGLWTAQSYSLPIACEGIANLRIAYHWQNNADGIGTDPSFAVDDITITTPTPLPVELISFYGVNEEQENHIYWSTASENNNAKFLLQKRISKHTDAMEIYNWETINMQNGAGNSLNLIRYQYTDTEIKEVEYYRLKQLDNDGRYSFLSIISISKNTDDSYKIYPNPTNGEINITFQEAINKAQSIEIQSMTGHIIYQKQVVSRTITVNLDNISPGFYQLFIKDGDSILFKEKIIKQ